MKLEFFDLDTCETKKVGMPTLEGIDTNITITSATLEKEMLKLTFIYSATYAPGGSYIRIGGMADYSGSEIKTVHEEWKKTKQIPGDIGEQVINTINYTASINAVFIARVFNLTPPITPPTIKFQQLQKSVGAVPNKKK